MKLPLENNCSLIGKKIINNLKPIKSDHYIGNFYKHEELLHLFEVAENTTIRLEVIL